jgi:hypothetical protein
VVLHYLTRLRTPRKNLVPDVSSFDGRFARNSCDTSKWVVRHFTSPNELRVRQRSLYHEEEVRTGIQSHLILRAVLCDGVTAYV